MKKLLGIVVLVFICSNANSAEDLSSTSYMLKSCKIYMSDNSNNNDELWRSTQCILYFRGAMEYATTKAALLQVKMERMGVDIDESKFVFLEGCVPGEVNNNQLIKIFIRHMENNPQDLYHPLMVNVSESLKQAFPCKN